MCVCEHRAALNISQPSVFKHLITLYKIIRFTLFEKTHNLPAVTGVFTNTNLRLAMSCTVEKEFS